MTAPRPRTPIEPRLLSETEAAAYCGVSPAVFRDWPGRPAPVRMDFGGTKAVRRVLYDRKLLDAWLDRMGGIHSISAQEAAMRETIRGHRERQVRDRAARS